MTETQCGQINTSKKKKKEERNGNLRIWGTLGGKTRSREARAIVLAINPDIWR